MRFGDYLRLRREENGWNQPEASQRIGIEQSYLSKLETGRSYPSEEVFAKLVAAYAIDSSDLAAQVDEQEIAKLREVSQVRAAVLGRERMRAGVTRGWLLVALFSFVLSGACAAIVMTARDVEYAEYHYQSLGVLATDEPLDAFDIVDERFDPQEAVERENQRAMITRLNEEYRVLRSFRGSQFIEPAGQGRRVFQLVNDRQVSEATPLRWFTVPALMLLAAAIGSLVLSMRWNR